MTNEEWIAKQIHIKNMYASPYESRASDVQQVVTDVDHFPYTRFYRGAYNDTSPRIWEREAGFHSLQNASYVKEATFNVTPHRGPTQIPCGTILPVSMEDARFKRLSNRDPFCVHKSP